MRTWLYNRSPYLKRLSAEASACLYSSSNPLSKSNDKIIKNKLCNGGAELWVSINLPVRDLKYLEWESLMLWLSNSTSTFFSVEFAWAAAAPSSAKRTAQIDKLTMMAGKTRKKLNSGRRKIILKKNFTWHRLELVPDHDRQNLTRMRDPCGIKSTFDCLIYWNAASCENRPSSNRLEKHVVNQSKSHVSYRAFFEFSLCFFLRNSLRFALSCAATLYSYPLNIAIIKFWMLKLTLFVTAG